METIELELVPRVDDAPAPPKIKAPDAAPTTALAVITVKQAALARFSQSEKDLRALAERYRDVAFDVSTPKGLKEAKEARHDLRENGRYVVQRIEKETRDELNDLKGTLKEHAEKLVAIVKPTEDAIDKQIEAREKAIKEEKEREEARKQAHVDAIATICGYAEQGRGKDSDALTKAIAFVETIDVSEAKFQEYEPAATVAKERTLEKLRELHTKALDDERIRTENEQRQLSLRLIASISAHVADGIGESTQALAERLVALKALVPEGDGTGEVMTAYVTATAQLEAMHGQAERAEKLESELAAMRAAQAPAPAPAPIFPPADDVPLTLDPSRTVGDALREGEVQPDGVDSGGTGEPASIDVDVSVGVEQADVEPADREPTITASKIQAHVLRGYQGLARKCVAELAAQRDELLAVLQQFVAAAGNCDAELGSEFAPLMNDADAAIERVFTEPAI